MRRARVLALTFLMAGATVAGIVYLFGLQFATGEVYPEFSSLRADAGGAKLLFDSLGRLAGVTVARNYVPLDFVRGGTAAILLLGLDPESFVSDSRTQTAMERLARRGNRVVAAMNLSAYPKAPATGSMYRNWEVRFGTDFAKGSAHRLFFSTARDWRVLDRAGGKLLAIERGFDTGSIVLLAESDDFSNQATVAADRLESVTAVLGDARRIVFDESHFGIAEGGSVAGLARRFRLGGMALGLALCAALFVWRNASAFPPPAEAAVPDRLSGRTSHAGLLTLLRRHVPPRDLAAVCWAEWLTANRRAVPAERVAEASGIAGDAAGRPLEALREIQSVLDVKGKGAL